MKSDKEYYEGRVSRHQQFIQEWYDLADEAISKGDSHTQESYLKLARQYEGELAQILDEADRAGVIISAPVPLVTRASLKAQVATLMGVVGSLSGQVVDLRAGADRAQFEVKCLRETLTSRDEQIEKLKAEVTVLRSQEAANSRFWSRVAGWCGALAFGSVALLIIAG